jgi:hypothetical protein
MPMNAVLEPLAPAPATRASLPLGEVAGLQTWWDYRPSEPDLRIRLKRVAARLFHERPRPASAPIKPAAPQERWVAYFAFLPQGVLSDAHRFTLGRLRDEGCRVLVICATPEVSMVPQELRRYADALYWKALEGYDFSAYTLALEVIAERSPAADVLILNDSMFGPFHPVLPYLRGARWDLMGFTGSALNENHLQSYGFILRSVHAARLAQLRDVFFADKAFDRADQVIWAQELLLARRASRHMTVGACWYSDGATVDDPCLRRPIELVGAGFPFMKKSLLGKMARFQDPERVRALLCAQGHPVQRQDAQP